MTINNLKLYISNIWYLNKNTNNSNIIQKNYIFCETAIFKRAIYYKRIIQTLIIYSNININ